MSSPYGSQYYSASGVLPIAVPAGKDQYVVDYYQGGHDAYSVSPPESENVSSVSGVASYSSPGYSATASYAGSSQGDYDSVGSTSNVDLHEYMQGRFAESFDPLPLDKAMATQAQT